MIPDPVGTKYTAVNDELLSAGIYSDLGGLSPIPIPVGTKYTAVAEGSTARLVHCEKCGQEYVYTVEVSAQGEGTDLGFMNDSAAQARAAQEAREAVKVQLQYAWRQVPCPSCGWYQAAMVQLLRQGQYQWMHHLGVSCAIACPLLIFGALVTTVIVIPGGWLSTLVVCCLWVIAISLGVTAAAMDRLRPKWMAQYTPNDEDVEARKLRGRRQALPKDEYEKVMRDLRKKHII